MMSLVTAALDAQLIPLPGDNPLAPKQLQNCWKEEVAARKESQNIGSRGLDGELSLAEMREQWAWSRAAHRAARERFETAESAFLDELSDKHSACADEARKQLARAVQEQLMLKLKAHGESADRSVSRGLEALLPALEAFEQFIALQQALTTAVLGTIKDRICKLRAERRRISCGAEDVLHNIDTLCRGMQLALGVVATTEEQYLHDLQENAADWERALEANKQRNDIGLREHMQALLPGLTLISQHQKGWLQLVRKDINGWLAGVEKELADRTARLRGTVGALIERDGGDEWPEAFEEIKAEAAQLQSVMESADAAVRRLMQ